MFPKADARIAVLVLLIASCLPVARAQTYLPPYTITTLAGQPSVTGTNDGFGNSAQFNSPNGIAMDGSGNLYVTDFRNNSLRQITPDGFVSTLVTNLPNISLGLAIDANTNLYTTSE